MSYVLRTRNMLQLAAESAALAASSQLPDLTNSVSLTQTYASKNMPAAQFGSILAASHVVLGNWPQSCTSGTNCFTRLPSGSDCGTYQCNAVQVTTRTAKVNGNALQLPFAAMIGIPTFDIAATAIAVYGAPAGPTWNMNIVQDVSQSFSTQLTSARSADQALLVHCTSAPSGSKLGITLFEGPGTAYQAPISVNGSTNGCNSALKTAIININACNTGQSQCKASIPRCLCGSHIDAE